MDYKPLEISPRVQRLREAYLKLPVAMENDPYVDKKYRHFCTGDRWVTLGFLEGWAANENAPTARRRRSLAEAAELRAAQPVILDDELLAGHLYLPEYTPEEQARYDKLCDEFRMSNITLLETGPRIDHLGLDFDKLLQKGVLGLLDEVRARRDALNLDDPDVYPEFEVLKQYDFYECCRVELEAVVDLQKRYAAHARELAQTASAPRREELLQMAATLDRVPAHPAQNFREAIQSVQFFLGTLFGLYPLNRPDRYLWEYYERDKASGMITQAEAQDLIDNFCLYVTDRVFSRAACGFLVGGQRVDGSLVENDLTYMFLTALDHIRMPDPNGALAVNAGTSDALLAYAAEVLSHGVTHPAFFNDDAIVQSLQEYGCSREDAVGYIHSTCAEISVPGRTRSHTTPFSVDLPRALQATCEACGDAADKETLRRAYLEKIAAQLKQGGFRYMMRMLEASRNGNEPMRTSALVDDCLARGRSIYEGGERYTFLQPILIGFSTAVDSLIAIETLVFEQKKLSLSRFTEIVKSDFENEEELRQYLIHRLPHYGNSTPEADETAAWLAQGIRDIFEHVEMLGGKLMMPGTFSYISHATAGGNFGATYDGRKAHTSYSDGCGPVQGRDVNGPTALVLSMTSWDQSAFLGGMVVNVKFAPGHLTRQEASQFIAMLRVFMARGGIEMQVNVVDRKTLEDAREHPEQHADLIVRIGGFSDYFTRLTPVLQQEIIERTEY